MMRRSIVRVLFVCFVFFTIGGIPFLPGKLSAQEIIALCPPVGLQARTATFQPGGIILTTFDRANIWVYNIDRNMRYPLPDTAPCGTNCHLSYDARWITYLDSVNRTFGKMRLDGTERTPLIRGATEVAWWTEDTLLIWTSAHKAYLRPEIGDDSTLETLYVDRVVNIQPGGYWGLRIIQQDDEFIREIVNTQTLGLAQLTGQHVVLGKDARYFNASSWSPDGTWLAFVAQHRYDPSVQIAGAEIFAIRPGDSESVQWTDLNSNYGAVRINGHAPGELSWSPDGAKIAFWVIEMLGTNPEENTGHAIIHILDIATGRMTQYCGFTTLEHTPNPPRLVWSPDSTHIAFGGNIPGDDKGYLLLALDIEEGIFTVLSEGIYPALGNPDVIAWGLPPR